MLNYINGTKVSYRSCWITQMVLHKCPTGPSLCYTGSKSFVKPPQVVIKPPESSIFSSKNEGQWFLFALIPPSTRPTNASSQYCKKGSISSVGAKKISSNSFWWVISAKIRHISNVSASEVFYLNIWNKKMFKKFGKNLFLVTFSFSFCAIDRIAWFYSWQ